ncbi:DeoR/GlpR family DNA-binding transcription regulator [Pelagibius sp. CAU 1746]|uniref:DeoR/GlpR family DNA-binding transcription regulator n=1 Tax=Pelagibius sp. CAU 1746 TaxID=3140370 RepID=UPI00325B1922
MTRPCRLSKQDRHSRILDETKSCVFVRISDLADRLGVSTETVRRDLDELSESGLIDRAYGGATAPLPRGAKAGGRVADGGGVDEAAAIGAAAAQRVKPGQTVMLSGGGIVLHTARELARLSVNLIVVTNSAAIAAVVAKNPTIQVILLPGVYNPAEGCVGGEDTVEYLKQFHADVAVVEASALTREGPYEETSVAATVKRAMLQRAAKKVLVAAGVAQWCKPVRKVCTLGAVDEVVVYERLAKPIAAAARRAGTAVSNASSFHTPSRSRTAAGGA